MTHDYTAHEALALILTSLKQSNPDLAARAQIAIDAGVDELAEQEYFSVQGRKRKTLKRKYRKNRPLTDAESIDAVLEVLKAHLVVHRQVVNSVIKQFYSVPVGLVREDGRESKLLVQPDLKTVGEPKSIEVELAPESARQDDEKAQTHVLETTPDSEIQELATLIKVIKEMTRFGN